MAIDWPDTPDVDDLFTPPGVPKTFRYLGDSVWALEVSAITPFIETLLDDDDALEARGTLEAAKVSWGTDPPVAPNTGEFWLDTTT